MTAGFTLGTSSGATLGTASGGTLGTRNADWLIDGQRIPDAITEVVTPGRTDLTFRVDRATLIQYLRPLRSNEGQYKRLQSGDGGYTTVDTAAGANTYTFEPPAKREPLRRETPVHVDRYEEELVAQSTDKWDVALDLVPAATRTDDATIALDEQTPSGGSTLPSGWWEFDTTNGPLALPPSRVSADISGVGDTGVDRVQLTLTLTFAQAHVAETALKRARGTRVRQIEDGTNRPLDETGDDANTLDVTSPTPDVIASQSYVVVDGFDSERLNEGFQRFDVTLLPA